MPTHLIDISSSIRSLVVWQMKDAAREGNGTADSAAQAEATNYKPKSKAKGKRPKGDTDGKPSKKK